MIEFDLNDVDLIEVFAKKLGFDPEYTYVTVSSDREVEDDSFDHEFGTEERYTIRPRDIEVVVQEISRDIREVLLDEATILKTLTKDQFDQLYFYCQRRVYPGLM